MTFEEGPWPNKIEDPITHKVGIKGSEGNKPIYRCIKPEIYVPPPKTFGIEDMELNSF